MILIAYDGSDDAKAAIERVAELVSGQPAVVVTVWEPYAQLLTRYPAAGAVMAGDDAGQIDDASRDDAEQTAEEGAALARAHGIDATGHGVTRRALDHRDIARRGRPCQRERDRRRIPRVSAGSARCCWAACRTRSSSTPTGRW